MPPRTPTDPVAVEPGAGVRADAPLRHVERLDRSGGYRDASPPALRRVIGWSRPELAVGWMALVVFAIAAVLDGAASMLWLFGPLAIVLAAASLFVARGRSTITLDGRSLAVSHASFGVAWRVRRWPRADVRRVEEAAGRDGRRACVRAIGPRGGATTIVDGLTSEEARSLAHALDATLGPSA